MTCTKVRSQLSDEPREYDHLNPTALSKPAYLMNVPFSLSAEVPNNVWMSEIKDEMRRIDINKAINQFLQLYHFITADALVYLLPTPRVEGLQDLFLGLLMLEV